MQLIFNSSTEVAHFTQKEIHQLQKSNFLGNKTTKYTTASFVITAKVH